ncbi:uncharacterized protein RJT20DRAFT_106134 [Scheffersomyces xylosifermentans]|uniref:uncharacterized protein n=1 Tax=Scheffersomyces xylosifermentans TaxID=1304137 RepID=UPI00315C57C9
MLEPSQRLRNAVIEGNLPIVRRLIARFPELWLNVDSSNKGWSNLHYASFYGNYLICFHLVSYINKNLGSIHKQYTSLDLLTFDGLTVLHLCVIKHHSQTLHYLLQEFPGRLWLNFPGGETQQTPIQHSCIYGFAEGVNLLLEFGANWELQDSNGDTCLHLCFQYGNLDCIRAIYKFVVMNYKDKEKSQLKISQFEAIKNKKGWVGSDYSSSFDLISSYKHLKKELFALNFDFQESMVLTDISSSNSSLLNLNAANNQSQTSLSDNKVLSSPIVPMSQGISAISKIENDDRLSPTPMNVTIPATVGNVATTTTTTTTKTGGRAHSQSLPAAPLDMPVSKPNKHSSSTTRSRSNTSYNYRPPIPINTGNIMVSPRTANPPHTPTVSKAQSLKSVTISPSVRTNSDEAPTSPQSVLSSNSSLNTSPVFHGSTNSGRKKSLSFSKGSGSYQLTSMNMPIGEDDQWPGINYSPTRTTVPSLPQPEHKLVAVQESGQSSRESPTKTTLENPVTLTSTKGNHHTEKEKPISRRSSSASIAANLAFNSSRNTNSNTESPRRRPSLSISTMHEGAVSHSYINRSRSSSGEHTPVLRKSRSSGTLQSTPMQHHAPKNSSSSILQHSSLNRSSNSVNGSSASLRTNVSSINFSRVR